MDKIILYVRFIERNFHKYVDLHDYKKCAL